ncbi:carboxypeptidase regulatory-like domain-containing protein [Silvibacterium acidisoli]|uniref:carboxypeptidase regulatory-like domain-containing protein n=1 Tax=Acidobacteriaceae bacterium ZG23-2 TaxID=2883246 RepID=UPI00406BE909
MMFSRFFASVRIVLLPSIVTVIGFVVLVSSASLHAQVLTGELDGTVHDSSGAAVSGATVVITNTDQKLVARTVQTDALGQFTAPLLNVGNYAVEVSAQGFESTRVTAIAVHVGTPSVVPVTMAVGSVTESVNVSADQVAPQVDTAASSTLIEKEQVTGLSLSSRNYMQLLYIQPGISSNVPGPDDRGNINTSGQVNTQTFSFNGNGTAANAYYLDGADTLKRAGQQPVAFPGVDFIQEINLQRASYTAEFGGAGAGFVSVQTKSGTTDLHGGAFGFFRSQEMNANTFLNNVAGIPRGLSRYADFGYYVGGPVWIPGHSKRNSAKTFFFFGQEFLRSENSVQQTPSNVPTALQRQGFLGNTTVTNINPIAQEYLTDIINKLPVPNNPADPQGIITQAIGTNNETQTLIRIDHQFNDRLSAFFRYLDDPFNLVVPNGFQVPTALPGVATSNMTNGSTNWLGHVTYIITPNHIIEGGYATRSNWVTAKAIGSMLQSNSPDIHVTLPYPVTIGQVPHLNINGGTYAVYSPYNERTPLHQIFANSTNAIGRNTLKFGVNVELMTGGSTTGFGNAGAFSFSSGNGPGGQLAGASQFVQAFDNFLQGAPATFTQANIDAAPAYRTDIYEGYAEDDVHVSPKLTLNLGIRYTYFASGTSATLEGQSTQLPILNFDPATYSAALAPTLNSAGVICTKAPCAGGKAPNPSYSPLNGIIVSDQNSPFGSDVQTTPNKNFAPRVGLSYDVFGNGKTALRGGFGLYYISITGNQYKFAQAQNYPNIQNATISTPSFADPGNGVPQFSASPNILQALQVHDSQPYSEQYSLDIQQQLPSDVVLDIGYYGNHGVHLSGNIDVNQAAPGAYLADGIIPGNKVTAANTPYLNQIRPYLGYSAISTQSNIFSSNYNSLQISMKKPFHGGGVVTASYTWSKALSNARVPQITSDLAAEYSHTDLDRTNVFNASFVYPLPFFRTQHGVIGHVAGGFEFSGIVSYGSGEYLTPTTTAVDPAGVGLLVGPATGRPDQISNPNKNAPHTFSGWFNKADYQFAPAGRGGDSRPDSILGPGYENWDLSLYRTVKFKESVNLQFRAESYNSFNHTNFTSVATVFGQSNFGVVTGTGTPRVLQLGAKLNF